MSSTGNDNGEDRWNKVMQSLNNSIHEITTFDQNDKLGVLIAYSDLAQNLDSFSEIINNLMQKIDISVDMSKELNSHIIRHLENLKHLKIQNKELLKAVEELKENQAKNADLKQEYNDLKNQKKELEKLDTFDQASLNELREQIKAIKEQKPWLLELEKLNFEIKYQLEDFIKCSRRTKEVLNAEISRRLENAEQITEDLSSLEEECKKINQKVSELENKGEQMRKHKEKLDGVLWGYVHANKAVAQAISSDETISVDQKIGLVEEELKIIDKELSKAIQIYDDLQKEKNKIIPL